MTVRFPFLTQLTHFSATAATFVGLIYVLILSFFIVVSNQLSPSKDFDVLILNLIRKMVGWGAREVSSLEKTLTYRSIVTLRLISCFIDYFFVAVSTISTFPKTY